MRTGQPRPQFIHEIHPCPCCYVRVRSHCVRRSHAYPYSQGRQTENNLLRCRLLQNELLQRCRCQRQKVLWRQMRLRLLRQVICGKF